MSAARSLLVRVGLLSGVLLTGSMNHAEAAPITGNLQLWLRADVGVLTQDNSGGGSSTTDVFNWQDQANANNGVQGSVTEMPQLVTGALNGLPIVRFTTEERLDEIIRCHEEHGCPIFNPHAFTLEEGGMKQVDHTHLAFKRETDPLGLLNPGKMLAWDHPDLEVGRRSYLYRSLEG